MRLNPNKVQVAPGGEPIKSVLGRSEDDEYPRYSNGAFEVACAEKSHGLEAAHFRKIRNGVHTSPSLASGSSSSCRSMGGQENTPVVLMTRYEYANLYHTFNDWYSLYQSMSAHKLEYGAFDLIWLDGHAWGDLDKAWSDLFSPRVSYLSKASACYNPSYFVADGGKSDLFSGCMGAAPDAKGFADYVVSRYNLNSLVMKQQILIIDRQPYLSHPRLKQPLPSVASRAFEDPQRLVADVQASFPNHDVKISTLVHATKNYSISFPFFKMAQHLDSRRVLPQHRRCWGFGAGQNTSQIQYKEV